MEKFFKWLADAALELFVVLVIVWFLRDNWKDLLDATLNIIDNAGIVALFAFAIFVLSLFCAAFFTVRAEKRKNGKS